MSDETPNLREPQAQNPQGQSSTAWERKVLEKIAMEGLAEQKARRRWGIFFKLLGFAYVGVLLVTFFGVGGSDAIDGQRHTALIQLNGVIQAKGDADADNVVGALQNAFDDKNTAGVVLRINSPGGSPVQAGIIYDEIRRLRGKHPEVPLYVVVDDICASGGYYVAAAADKIYVDKASIVGSIGVLMDGFGFTVAMEKVGVERRLMTAGENKGFLDPFSPLDPKQKAYAEDMLQEIHGQFVEAVRKGRGQRLKETPDMFSGLMWSGAKSVHLGLTDGFGTVESVARDVVKVENIRDYTLKQNFAERIAKRFGSSVAESAMGALGNLQLR
jgi:protease-4